MARRMEPGEIEKISGLIDEGYSLTSISKIMGRHTGTIKSWISEYGLNKPQENGKVFRPPDSAMTLHIDNPTSVFLKILTDRKLTDLTPGRVLW